MKEPFLVLIVSVLFSCSHNTLQFRRNSNYSKDKEITVVQPIESKIQTEKLIDKAHPELESDHSQSEQINERDHLLSEDHFIGRKPFSRSSFEEYSEIDKTKDGDEPEDKPVEDEISKTKRQAEVFGILLGILFFAIIVVNIIFGKKASGLLFFLVLAFFGLIFFWIKKRINYKRSKFQEEFQGEKEFSKTRKQADVLGLILLSFTLLTIILTVLFWDGVAAFTFFAVIAILVLLILWIVKRILAKRELIKQKKPRKGTGLLVLAIIFSVCVLISILSMGADSSVFAGIFLFIFGIPAAIFWILYLRVRAKNPVSN